VQEAAEAKQSTASSASVAGGAEVEDSLRQELSGQREVRPAGRA
jgi:hypothetical protein